MNATNKKAKFAALAFLTIGSRMTTKDESPIRARSSRRLRVGPLLTPLAFQTIAIVEILEIEWSGA